MRPQISIIVPCYNAVHYIHTCLDSILGQSYEDFEVICINDGSTDGTLAILENYEARDPRIKLFDQENKGLSESRSRGINYATGKYTLFVDSDDWLQLDTLEVILNSQIDYDIICFSYIREFKEQSLPKKIGLSGDFSASELQRRIVGPIGHEVSKIENLDALATVWGKLYKSEKIKNIAFTEVSQIGTWEDGLFNLEVLENCDQILILDQTLYHYRKSNQASFTNQYRKDLYKKWIFKFSLIDKLITEKNDTYKQALQNRIGISVLGLILTEVNNNNPVGQKLKGIKNILSEKSYHIALKNLDKSEMPIHWKIFYTFAEHKMSLGVFLLSNAILLLINRKN